MAFTALLNGTATNAQIGAFLMGLSINGETSDIIASGASILRNNAIKIMRLIKMNAIKMY